MGMGGPARELDGLVAIVTGAAGGIGRGLVARLVEDGATVIACDIDHPPGSLLAGSAAPVACDVSDATAVAAMVDGVVARHGRVDIVVNNAGIFDNIASTIKMEAAAFDRDLAVNLSGPFYVVRSALPHMLRRRFGRIVNISSMSAGGAFKQAGYGASKLGLIALTRTVALEFAPAGITSNAVLPGLIGTEKALSAPDDILAGALRAIPAGRTGTVDEIADAVSFLSRPSSGYINGVALPVDGGALLLQLHFGRKSALEPEPS